MLDYGTHLLLAEIFSGRLTVGTQVHGNELSPTDDTEKMVLKKALQLNGTAVCILQGRMPLFPTPTAPSRRILPVIVLGEMYPVNPFTQTIVDSLIRKEKLFEDGRIEKLAIIVIADLEILEGMAE